MRRVRIRAVVASVLVAGSVPVAVAGLAPAGAQVAPSLVISPLRVEPQATVTFTVRDCAVAPELQVGESDFIRLVEPTATGVAGEWSAQLEAGLTDWTVWGTCGDVELGEVVVDIDYPLMSFLPIGAYAPEPDPPSEVFGSDCPDDTEAFVTFEATRGTFPSPNADEVGRQVTVGIDGRGDWQAPVPLPSPGSVVQVTASCGDVRYAPLTFTTPLAEPFPSTSTTVPTPPSVVEPPPAVPRSGRPSFTG